MSTRYILLAGLSCACLGATGCRSAPPTVEDPPSFADSEVQAVQSPKMDSAELDRKVAEAAARLSRVERNGIVYFCKRSRHIGTNIATLQCMTESQLRVEVETMAQVRDEMRNKMGKCTAGRSGHGGPCGGW